MLADQPEAESPPDVKGAWRKGPLSLDPTPEVQLALEQVSLSAVSSIEEKKLSKHAKRRANKKKKIITSSGAAEDDLPEDFPEL